MINWSRCQIQSISVLSFASKFYRLWVSQSATFFVYLHLVSVEVAGFAGFLLCCNSNTNVTAFNLYHPRSGSNLFKSLITGFMNMSPKILLERYSLITCRNWAVSLMNILIFLCFLEFLYLVILRLHGSAWRCCREIRCLFPESSSIYLCRFILVGTFFCY